jgi:hypothetical protein
MKQAADDKLSQYEAEESRKEKAALNQSKPKVQNQEEDAEEEDPDFMDDENEKAIMQRMVMERMQESGPRKKKGDRQTEGIGRS